MRIQNIDDLIKILYIDKPSEAFEKMLREGTLEDDIPELTTLVGAKQNFRYHLEDVWEHTMMCVDIAAGIKDQSNNPEVFMIGTLLHDIGKPATCTERIVKMTGEVVINNLDHNKAGVPIAAKIMDRLGSNADIKEDVMDFILFHDIVYEITRIASRDLNEARKKLDSILINESLADYILFNEQVDSVGLIPGPKNNRKENIDKFRNVYQELVKGDQL